MVFAETHLRKWWDRRSDDQRARLKQATENHRLEPDVVTLLMDTQCPVGPIGTRWESDPEFAWSWPDDVRTFVREQ